jgi:DNA invertase Pin-like site-specific DNA recombinase
MNATSSEKAVIVVRVSTEQQSNSEVGASTQLDICRRWAIANGVEVVEVCEDLGVSGSLDITKRNGLNEAKNIIQSGKASIVICASLSRIGRNLFNVLKFIDEIGVKKSRSRLVCVSDNIDTKNGGFMANAMLQMMGIFAELELENIVSRNRQVKAYLKNNGRYCGGRMGVFLKMEVGSDGKKYVSHKNEEVMNSMVKMREMGMTYRQIAEELANLGIKNSRGTNFSLQSVQQLLKRHGNAFQKAA